ncbi:MAG: hypothetical protein E6I27_16805 [Chloroflexi bacterium]|nr:MAG: hypothetical protein E6I27_16805 [Chloroflexota bacterium]
MALNAQYARDSKSAPAPKIGRNTNGGLEMTSKPLSEVEIRAGVATKAGVSSGEADGDGDSDGVGEGEGDALAAWRVKFAHGLGCTLAQSLCTPGGSPAKGLTRVLKLPLLSAVAEPATLVG